MLGHLLAVAHLVQAVVLTDHPAALNHQEIIVKCLRPPNDVRRLSRFLWTHLWRLLRYLLARTIVEHVRLHIDKLGNCGSTADGGVDVGRRRRWHVGEPGGDSECSRAGPWLAVQ
jgi:hypothetical protein